LVGGRFILPCRTLGSQSLLPSCYILAASSWCVKILWSGERAAPCHCPHACAEYNVDDGSKATAADDEATIQRWVATPAPKAQARELPEEGVTSAASETSSGGATPDEPPSNDTDTDPPTPDDQAPPGEPPSNSTDSTDDINYNIDSDLEVPDEPPAQDAPPLLGLARFFGPLEDDCEVGWWLLLATG
jgi:hypothetical protein